MGKHPSNRISDEKRALMIGDYRAGALAVREIEKKHGCGTGTLHRILRECGVSGAEGRAKKFNVDLAGRRFGALKVVRYARSSDKGRGAIWLCCCDCGAEKEIAGRQLTAGKRGVKSCGASVHHAWWKGGRFVTDGGYIRVKAPDSPQCTRKDGYVLEHRLVMSEVVGRVIKQGETVHHINGIRSDNRPENLELWGGHHGKGQRVNDGIAEAVKYLQEHAPHLLADSAKNS